MEWYWWVLIAAYILTGLSLTIGCLVRGGGNIEAPLFFAIVAPFIAPIMTVIYLLFVDRSWLPSLPKGVTVKRFLFKFLLTFVLGYSAADFHLLSMAWDWYKAPPPPPSAEAQKLIASLDSAKGWRADGMRVEGNSSYPQLTGNDGKVAVVIRKWYADIHTGNAKCNDTYTLAEQAAINDAAKRCLSRLTSKAVGD